MAVDTVTRITMGALEAAVKARVPVMLVGAPGTGKTETVRELADRLGYELITVIGSQMDSTDITGLPKGEKVIERENGNDVWGTVYLAPWWQIRILQNKKVILFLDEFSNTPGSTRASMLTMLQNREFPNGEVMPPETIVIGAMNPAEQAADGYELDLPTTNRLFFLSWNPSISSWYEGMLNAWGKEVEPEEMKWRTKIVKFIKDNPTWLHREPDDVSSTEVFGVNKNDASQMEVLRSAWASRRTWDKLSQVLPFAPDDVSTQDTIIQGLVGYAASAAFRDWLRKNDVIDPKAVLADPTQFDWKEMSLDDSNLVFRAVVDMVSADNGEEVIRVFATVADAGRADLGAPFMRDMVSALTSNAKVGKEAASANKKLLPALLAKYQNISRHSNMVSRKDA